MSVRVIEDGVLIVIVDDGFAAFVEDSGGLSQDWLKGNIQYSVKSIWGMIY